MSKKKILLTIMALTAFTALTTYRIRYQTHDECAALNPIMAAEKNIPIQGKIIDLPKEMPHGTEFMLKTTAIDNRPMTALLSLAWYGRHPPVWVADTWKMTVHVHALQPHHNPGVFDYADYLQHQGICAQGSVVSHYGNVLLDSGFRLPQFWQYLRQMLQHDIAQAIPNRSLAAFIAALTVGSRSLMTPVEWQVFARTGTTYLIVISGIHIALLASAGYFLVTAFWWCFPRLGLWIARPRAATMGALVFAFIYSALAGWVLPTQRSLIMLAMVLLGQWWNRQAPLTRRLFWAAVAVIAWDPFSIFSASFWLSFIAVAWIGYAFLNPSSMRFWWQRWLYIQLYVTVGLLPLSLYYFQQFSIVIFLANFIALPWVEFVLVPAGLLSCVLALIHPALGQVAFLWTAHLLNPLWQYLTWLSQLPWAIWVYGVSSLWMLIALHVGILLLLAPRGFPLRWLGCFAFLPLLFYLPFPLWKGQARITVFDTGKSLAYLIETQKHALAYVNQKQRAWVIQTRLLRNESARDDKMLWLSPQFLTCTPGQTFTWDHVQFQWIDKLCVLQISTAHNSVWIVHHATLGLMSRLSSEVTIDPQQKNTLILPSNLASGLYPALMYFFRPAQIVLPVDVFGVIGNHVLIASQNSAVTLIL